MKTQQDAIAAAIIVAGLLDRLDASRKPVDAHQYRVVAQRLAALMGEDTDAVDWQPLLKRSPAAAAIYENLHYDAAGLCRSPLAAAADAELAAHTVIDAARRLPPAGAQKPEASEA